MAQFSERMGITKPKNIQLREMDADLRNTLWNAISGIAGSGWPEWWNFAKRLAIGFFKIPVEDVPGQIAQNWVRQRFERLPWYRVYDLIEFICAGKPDLQKRINRLLEREVSGYRFIGGVLVPISDDAEIAEIDQALSSRLLGPREHVHAALQCLGQKPEPDYRNAVREAITAVESATKTIAGEEATTLAPALAALAARTKIHPALRGAFERLYGYTNDEKGIRHALLEEKANVGFEEAKFMVVACSAFVNFLLGKAAKTRII